MYEHIKLLNELLNMNIYNENFTLHLLTEN